MCMMIFVSKTDFFSWMERQAHRVRFLFPHRRQTQSPPPNRFAASKLQTNPKELPRYPLRKNDSDEDEDWRIPPDEGSKEKE